MKIKYKLIGILIPAIILLLLIIPLLPGDLLDKPVYGVGYSTINMTSTNTTTGMSFLASNMNSYLVNCTAPLADTIVGGNIRVGWWSQNVAPNRVVPNAAILGFNLSSIPAGTDIIAVNLILTNTSKSDTSPVYSDFYWSVVKTDCGTDMNISTDDNPKWFNFWVAHSGGRVSAPQNYTSLVTGGNYTIPLVDKIKALTKYGSTNMTYFEIMTENQAQAWAPTIEPATHIYFECNSYATLQIVYAAPPVARTMNKLVNAADFTGVITGSENITGVSWLTPRAAFADEQVGFRVEGNPGCSFSYALVDSAGTILETGTNITIKVNNYYYNYYGPFSATYTGWLRLVIRQTTDSKYYYSLWGRVEHPPSATQRNLTVSSYSTEYPPYDNEFSTYMIYKNGVGYLYWKSNLLAVDMAGYSLKLMVGGDPLYGVSWNATMEYLNSNYFNTVDPLNYVQADWRYLMFSPEITTPGFNNYDGFIIDVAKEYTAEYCGFWQGEIRKDSDGSILTWTESANFYLNELSQGVGISVYDKASGDSLLDAKIIVGVSSKVATRLANLNITVIDNLGNIMSSTESFIIAGENNITFLQPTISGSYQTRFTFYNAALVPDYQYIRDMAFTLTNGKTTPGTTPGSVLPTAGGFTNWINSLMAGWGMNDMAGHWVVVLVLCVIVAAIIGVWGDMPLVATVIDILIFGLAIYIKWIDVWVIALLAIAAGITIYRIFKHNVDAKEV